MLKDVGMVVPKMINHVEIIQRQTNKITLYSWSSEYTLLHSCMQRLQIRDNWFRKALQSLGSYTDQKAVVWSKNKGEYFFMVGCLIKKLCFWQFSVCQYSGVFYVL